MHRLWRQQRGELDTAPAPSCADLRLTDLSVQLDDLREKLEQMQHILKEVE